MGLGQRGRCCAPSSCARHQKEISVRVFTDRPSWRLACSASRCLAGRWSGCCGRRMTRCWPWRSRAAAMRRRTSCRRTRRSCWGSAPAGVGQVPRGARSGPCLGSCGGGPGQRRTPVRRASSRSTMRPGGNGRCGWPPRWEAGMRSGVPAIERREWRRPGHAQSQRSIVRRHQERTVECLAVA